MPTYLQLTPPAWPQDEIQVPDGLGMMPPVQHANAEVSRSEYATYSTMFAIPNNQAAGVVQNAFLATDQDGDFWCDQIAVQNWVYIGAAKGFAGQCPVADLAVTDARTGRSLFFPSTVPLIAFQKHSMVNFTQYVGSEPGPTGFRETGTLIQPFCFTRQGGIQLQLTFPIAMTAPTGRFETTVMFSGWKEYAHASR